MGNCNAQNNPHALGVRITDALQRAFDHFNRELWEDRLPPCAVIVHRDRRAYGYFWPERWKHRDDEERFHEIALNPDTMTGRPINEILSTLVHEMAHHEQQVFGKPSRKGYHNKEWAAMMDRVGLTPSATGEPGGKRTGQKMTHFIVTGGPFALACDRLLSSGFVLDWGTVPPLAETKGKSGQRVKYTCPSCDASVWGKGGLSVQCKPCGAEMLSAEGGSDGD